MAENSRNSPPKKLEEELVNPLPDPKTVAGQPFKGEVNNQLPNQPFKEEVFNPYQDLKNVPAQPFKAEVNNPLPGSRTSPPQSFKEEVFNPYLDPKNVQTQPLKVEAMNPVPGPRIVQNQQLKEEVINPLPGSRAAPAQPYKNDVINSLPDSKIPAPQGYKAEVMNPLPNSKNVPTHPFREEVINQLPSAKSSLIKLLKEEVINPLPGSTSTPTQQYKTEVINPYPGSTSAPPQKFKEEIINPLPGSTSTSARPDNLRPPDKYLKYDSSLLPGAKNREEVFQDLDSALVKIQSHPGGVQPQTIQAVAPVGGQTTEATTHAALAKEGTELCSMASEISLGFGDDSAETRTKIQIQEGPELHTNLLRTSVAFVMHCSHNKMALMKHPTKGYLWLPYTIIDDDRRVKISDQQYELFPLFSGEEPKVPSLHHQSLTDTQRAEILREKRKNQYLEAPQLHHEYSIQMPDGSFVNRYLFLAKWAEKPKIECCRNTSSIEWYPLEQLILPDKSLLQQLWGHEVQSLAKEVRQRIENPELPLEPYCSELIGQDIQKFLLAVNDDCNATQLNSLQKKLPKDLIAILNSCGMRERDVLKIYCDYVQHCYPAETMSQRAFLNYCFKIEFNCWDEDHLISLFRSMQFFSKDFLHFPEFLLGIAILGSKESNSAIRIQYIFRFYDVNNDGFLDREDFKNLLRDVKSMSGKQVVPQEIDKECTELIKTLKLEGDDARCGVEDFLRNYHSIPGAMNVLFRPPQDFITLMHTNVSYQLVQHPSDVPFRPHLVGSCNRCKPKKYNLAYHYVQLNPQGRINDNRSVISIGDIDEKVQFEPRDNDCELKHSIEVLFSENHIANRTLKIVRQLFDFIRLTPAVQRATMEKVTSELNIELLAGLCKEVTEILALEPRVLKVSSPCFVMGDIHGNISDLLVFERQLWPLAPTAQGPSVLFLGDYVDRGDFSIECVCYLFAMKLLMPNKFFLLRGNHEIRSIQKNFTFFRECVNKYHKNGSYVFETFNQALDHLPIVGIIDESIYCAHGGIPQATNKIEDLYSIPCPLPEPESGSRIAWEILWNDPVTDEELKEVCSFQNINPDCGYADNIRRSTAFYFGERATRAFLKANNLSHVIRAHELELGGYRIHHSGCLLTVFSSSRYCNTANRAASIYCEIRKAGGLLKIISLDT